MEICVWVSSRSLVLNTFALQSRTAEAIYTFSLAESLGWEQEKQPFTLFGEEGKVQDVVKQLQLYVAEVGSLRLSAEYNRHPLTEIADMPFDLATQILHQ